MEKILFIIFTYIFITINYAQTPPIVYVAGDGTGDFNCDGIEDQVEINQALDFVAQHAEFTTVYLKGPMTYWINETIYISGNTILEGDKNAVIKLVDNAGWNTKFKPLIGQKGLNLALGLDNTDITTPNITIRGFEIDGNRENQSEPSGNSYYSAIVLQNCYNITINDMYIHDCLAEGVQIINDKYDFDVNLKFYNNRIHRSGHDGIYIGNAINIEIYDNIFTDNRTDAHVRLQYCNHFKIYNNIMGNNPDNRNSGGIGIDIQAHPDIPLDDAEIYGNFIYGKSAFPGIWLWQMKKGGELNTHKNVYIHHNIITGNQGAGIAIYGFNNTIIENNVIEFNGQGNNRSFTDNVLLGPQSGITFYEGCDNITRGFRTIVRNNIIGNNAAYGIENRKPKLHTFISEYNCIYNNLKGNYKNVFSSTDIYVFPDYACDNPLISDDNRIAYGYYILSEAWQKAIETQDFSGDLGAKKAKLVYHLKSEYGRWDGNTWVYDQTTSFCINQGNPNADYSNEPLPNGSRINIGAFGNTEFASMGDRIANINHFGVYPNPTLSLLDVSEEFQGNYYEIVSISGKIVQKGYVREQQIDLSQLDPGIYLIRIKMYILPYLKTFKVIKL